MPKDISDPGKYRDWIEAHPEGYVATINPSPNYYPNFGLFIHSSKCANVIPNQYDEFEDWESVVPPRGMSKVVGADYIKLLNWADSKGYGRVMKNHQCVKGKDVLSQAYVFRTRRNLVKAQQIDREIVVKVSGVWRRDYRKGDTIVFYQLKPRSGIYALGEITEAEGHYNRVIKMKVVRALERVILKADIDSKPGLKELSGLIAQAGKMPAGDAVYELDENKISFRQWEVLKKQIGIGPNLLLKK